MMLVQSMLMNTRNWRTSVDRAIDLREMNSRVWKFLIVFYKLLPCWGKVAAMATVGREMFDEPALELGDKGFD